MSGLDLFPRADVSLFAVGSGCAVENRAVGDSGDVSSRDGHDSPQASCVHVVKLCQVCGAKSEGVDALDKSAGNFCLIYLEFPGEIKFGVVPYVSAFIEFSGGDT